MVDKSVKWIKTSMRTNATAAVPNKIIPIKISKIIYIIRMQENKKQDKKRALHKLLDKSNLVKLSNNEPYYRFIFLN